MWIYVAHSRKKPLMTTLDWAPGRPSDLHQIIQWCPKVFFETFEIPPDNEINTEHSEQTELVVCCDSKVQISKEDVTLQTSRCVRSCVLQSLQARCISAMHQLLTPSATAAISVVSASWNLCHPAYLSTRGTSKRQGESCKLLSNLEHLCLAEISNVVNVLNWSHVSMVMKVDRLRWFGYIECNKLCWLSRVVYSEDDSLRWKMDRRDFSSLSNNRHLCCVPVLCFKLKQIQLALPDPRLFPSGPGNSRFHECQSESSWRKMEGVWLRWRLTLKKPHFGC